MRVRATHTVKIGGVHRIPSQSEGRDAGVFEWDKKWGDPQPLFDSGSLELVNDAAGSSGGSGPTGFSSGAAESRAQDAGLTIEDFEGREPSGKNGFTVADVEALVAELDQAGQGDGDEDDEGDEAEEG